MKQEEGQGYLSYEPYNHWGGEEEHGRLQRQGSVRSEHERGQAGRPSALAPLAMPAIPAPSNSYHSPPRPSRPRLYGYGEESRARRQEEGPYSPTCESPSSNTGHCMLQGMRESLPGKGGDGSPQTTPTSAMGGQKYFPHRGSRQVIRLTAEAGIRSMAPLITSGSGIGEEAHHDDLPFLPERGMERRTERSLERGLGPRRTSRRQAARQGAPVTPETQASLTTSQLTAALSSPTADRYQDGPQGSYGDDPEGEGDGGEFDLDFDDSDDLGERQPQKRLRRRVVVETKDPNGKPYSALEIRRMKRRITNRESARRMRLKRQEEWGEVKQQTRQLRNFSKQQAQRILQLEQHCAHLRSEATHWSGKYHSLSVEVATARQLGSPSQGSQPLGDGTAVLRFQPPEGAVGWEGYEPLPNLTIRTFPHIGAENFNRSASLVAPGVFGGLPGGHPQEARHPPGDASSLHQTASLPDPQAMDMYPPYLASLLPYGGTAEGRPSALEKSLSSLSTGGQSQPLGAQPPVPELKQEPEHSHKQLRASQHSGEEEGPFGERSMEELKSDVSRLPSLKSIDAALGLSGDVEDVFTAISEEAPTFGDGILPASPYMTYSP